MRSRARRRTAGALVVAATLVVAASCTSGAIDTETSAPPTRYGSLDAFVAALDPDVPIVESTLHSAQISEPSPTVRIWSDGRYAVTFGTVHLPFDVESNTALAGVVVEGHVDATMLDTNLTALMEADIADLASSIATTECPIIMDGGTSRYTLTSPTATREIQPCDAWSRDEYPAPLDLAAELAAAARNDQSDLVAAYRDYGSGLRAFERADWDESSLVVGTIARIDVTEPRLAFEVDEVLVGTTEPRRYALVGDDFDRTRPDELALFERAQPGDRVMALVGPETDVYPLGFLDGGDLVVTEPSNSVLSLGHLGFVAVEHELYVETGVECELSDFYRPDRDEELSSRDALIEIATREAAIDLRTEWIQEARAELPTGTNLVSTTLTGIGSDEIAIVTDGAGTYLTHARQAPRPDDRDTRTLRIWVPEGLLDLQVWVAPDNVTTGCGAMEFGPLASSFGDLVATIATEVEPGVPGRNDPVLRITVDIQTGDYTIEP